MLQEFPALRLDLLRSRSPRERMMRIAEYIDALDSDFRDAFPEAEPLFRHGMAEELRQMIELREEIISK